MILDLLLVTALGFLGSFGHCVGMCSPLTIAFALSQKSGEGDWGRSLRFHGLLNLGRILSYGLVGAGIGALGSVLVAGGQLAGIESPLRRGMAIVTGILLIWFGLGQIAPNILPRLPFLHPIAHLHERLQQAMMQLSSRDRPWTPLLLGMIWGMIPCGFLYAAQIKAAETSNLTQGGLTMLAFGLGTVPAMLGIGISASGLSHDRRSQLFRLGGWVSLAIGGLTLLRSDAMVDFTGHGALVLLMLALVARPLHRLLPGLLPYRRALGVGAFLLSVAHTAHMLDHSFEWNLEAISYLLPNQQVGMWLGMSAIVLMTPAALTSFDGMVKQLGHYWHWLHWLTVPALVLAATHTLLTGSHYFANPEPALLHYSLIGLVAGATIAVLLVRSRWIWSVLALERFYGSPR